MTSQNPYLELPSQYFYKTNVAEANWLDPLQELSPKFQIDEGDRVMSAGSCFAQHITQCLRDINPKMLVDEELPPYSLGNEDYLAHGFHMFSARYSNIYTCKQLNQLITHAIEDVVPDDLIIYEPNNNSWIDYARPGVSHFLCTEKKDIITDRSRHLAAVRQVIKILHL